MTLSVSTLVAIWMLVSPAPLPCAGADAATILPRIEGRVDRHADLNGDGVPEVFVRLPDGCDDEGRCKVMVLQPGSAGGYRVLLAPTEVWDLAPGSERNSDGWLDLVEAKREGPAMDDISLLRWRFDGSHYAPLESTRTLLSSTPDWVS